MGKTDFVRVSLGIFRLDTLNLNIGSEKRVHIAFSNFPTDLKFYQCVLDKGFQLSL